MAIFSVGTLVLLLFLAWATWRTAQVLREIPLTQNLLLLPAENLLRAVLIAVCLGLALVSGQPYARFGWDAREPVRDLIVGVTTGIVVALILPRLTNFAVARFGAGIYSPIVVRSIMPRHRREWMLVPLALAPAVLLEELLFRSLLLGGFADLVPPIFLALGWSLIFGWMHLPQGALGMIVAAALGLLLSTLFLFTGGLLAPCVAHYVINLLQLVWAARDKTWLVA